MPEKKLRCFIAVPLPAAVRHLLKGTQTRVRAVPGLRASFPRDDGLHITLRFLGETTHEQIAAVQEAMDRTASLIPPFDLHLSGLGSFPRNRPQARVLWCGVSGDTHCLEGMYGRLGRELETLGYEREKNRFSAHITLARCKRGVDRRVLDDILPETAMEIESPPFSVRAMNLYKSRLTPGGAVYTLLHSSLLTKAK